MKKVLAGKLALALTALFALGEAQAHPSQVATYVYYSGTQPVGQSILSCEGLSQHWGDAPLATQAGAVSVVYSCATGSAIRIIIPTSVDPWVQANFCNTTGICDEGPGLVNGAGVLVPGFNSN